jgi:hypothetical protein
MNFDVFGEVIVEPKAEEELDLSVKKDPFSAINSIANKTPCDIENYNPWLTNTSFSNNRDTVIYANEMNKFHFVDDKMQYDFYYNVLPKKKYFSKWQKKSVSKSNKYIMLYYDVNEQKAEEIEKILKASEIKFIVDYENNKKGGKK